MSTLASSYYDEPDLTDRVNDALRQAGVAPERLRLEDLTAIDQFHAFGLGATRALAELAELGPASACSTSGRGSPGPPACSPRAWTPG